LGQNIQQIPPISQLPKYAQVKISIHLPQVSQNSKEQAQHNLVLRKNSAVIESFSGTSEIGFFKPY